MYYFYGVVCLVSIVHLTAGFHYGLNDEQLRTYMINFKKNIENKVKILSTSMQAAYIAGCSPINLDCLELTYNICDGTGPRTCFTNFPSRPSCLHDGVSLGAKSGVLVPNIMQPNNLLFDLRKFICVSAKIESTFSQLLYQNQKDFTFAYMGSSSGGIRIAPSFRWAKSTETKRCADFDPRIRPWYVSAITGSKIVVILFDISRTMSSMFPGARFKNAKTTLQILLTTLNSNDYVGVILFSSWAKTLPGFPDIVKATDSNKEAIANLITSIQTQDGITNYMAAVQKGIQLRINLTTSCSSTFFILLTDGYTENDDVASYQAIPELVDSSLDGEVILVSFVYGVEQNIKYEEVVIATYKYKGILFRIWDGIDEFTMVDKLSSFYEFLSEGIEGRREPSWSEPYEDAFGFGKILSVSVPIYVPNRIPRIVGVAALDVLLSKFTEQQISLQLVSQIFSRSQQCYISSISNQTLDYLRCKARADSNCTNITNQNQQQNCSKKLSNIVFYSSPVDTTIDDDLCCGPTIREFYIILFSSLGGFVFVVIVGVAAKKGLFRAVYERFCKKPESSEADDNSSQASDREIFDPENKYKNAEISGVKIYHEPQFNL